MHILDSICCNKKALLSFFEWSKKTGKKAVHRGKYSIQHNKTNSIFATFRILSEHLFIQILLKLKSAVPHRYFITTILLSSDISIKFYESKLFRNMGILFFCH